MTQFTSNIMKVGAHLDDTKALVDVWDLAATDEENVRRIVDGNLLGLPSQSRANDVMVRALRPAVHSTRRWHRPSSPCTQFLADAFRDACYYELTRDDALVACFVEEQLNDWWAGGPHLRSKRLTPGEWIDKLAIDGRVPDWSAKHP